MINALPPELATAVLRLLDLADAAAVVQVCRNFHGQWMWYLVWYLKHGRQQVTFERALIRVVGTIDAAWWLADSEDALPMPDIDRALHRCVYTWGCTSIARLIVKKMGFVGIPAVRYYINAEFTDLNSELTDRKPLHAPSFGDINALAARGHLGMLRWILRDGVPTYGDYFADFGLPGRITKYTVTLALLNEHYHTASWCVAYLGLTKADLHADMQRHPRYDASVGVGWVDPRAVELHPLIRACEERHPRLARWLYDTFALDEALDPATTWLDPGQLAWFRNVIVGTPCVHALPCPPSGRRVWFEDDVNSAVPNRLRAGRRVRFEGYDEAAAAAAAS